MFKIKTIGMGLFFILSVSVSLAQSPSDYKTFIKEWEGHRNTPYRDTNGWTVGIGHSLTAHNQQIGSFYSDTEIDQFFFSDLEECLVVARKKIVGFDTLPKDAKLVVVSLIFNLGEGGFNKFKKFKKAIDNRDFVLASSELKDSVWYRQVGRRAKNHVALLQNIKS
jgi:lysozyme